MPLISARLSITFWGDRDRGQGSQKSVIDSKRRRLKSLCPVALWGHGKSARERSTGGRVGIVQHHEIPFTGT
jgi:hypothetical protein